MKKQLLIFLLPLFFISGVQAQTKLIHHKSHSGSDETFKMAYEGDLFDIGASNFGGPPWRGATMFIDSVVYLGNEEMYMVQNYYCTPGDICNTVKSGIYKMLDTVEDLNIPEVKKYLQENFSFGNHVDSIHFVGFEKLEEEKRQKKEAKAASGVPAQPSGTSGAEEERRPRKMTKKEKRKAKKEKRKAEKSCQSALPQTNNAPSRKVCVHAKEDGGEVKKIPLVFNQVGQAEPVIAASLQAREETDERRFSFGIWKGVLGSALAVLLLFSVGARRL